MLYVKESFNGFDGWRYNCGEDDYEAIATLDMLHAYSTLSKMERLVFEYIYMNGNIPLVNGSKFESYEAIASAVGTDKKNASNVRRAVLALIKRKMLLVFDGKYLDVMDTWRDGLISSMREKIDIYKMKNSDTHK